MIKFFFLNLINKNKNGITFYLKKFARRKKNSNANWHIYFKNKNFFTTRLRSNIPENKILILHEKSIYLEYHEPNLLDIICLLKQHPRIYNSKQSLWMFAIIVQRLIIHEPHYIYIDSECRVKVLSYTMELVPIVIDNILYELLCDICIYHLALRYYT